MNEEKKRANDIKQKLFRQGLTLKKFAELHGFPYHAVSSVVRGIRKGYYGQGREIAEKLGILPTED